MLTLVCPSLSKQDAKMGNQRDGGVRQQIQTCRLLRCLFQHGGHNPMFSKADYVPAAEFVVIGAIPEGSRIPGCVPAKDFRPADSRTLGQITIKYCDSSSLN